jgi:hypothetical protein
MLLSKFKTVTYIAQYMICDGDLRKVNCISRGRSNREVHERSRVLRDNHSHKRPRDVYFSFRAHFTCFRKSFSEALKLNIAIFSAALKTKSQL